MQAIREQGKTVLVITHFMDEAEFLCDRVAIIDHGRVLALDTPDGLVGSFDREARVLFEVTSDADWSALQAVAPVTAVVQHGDRVTVTGSSDGLLVAVVTWLESQRIPFRALSSRQASLEDVFLRLTGRRIRD